MTLSHPDVCRFLSSEVVPCWEMVRPVPKVAIDFGEGRVLQRTLQGNTILTLCLPDGRAVDAWPGVYLPPALLGDLRKTLAFVRESGGNVPPEKARTWHQEQVTEAIRSERMRVTHSKAVVESPLLAALGVPQPSDRRAAASPVNLASDPKTPLDPKVAFAAVSARIEDVSKHPATIEQLRARYAGNPNGRQLSDEELAHMALEADSRASLTLLRPAVHLLFSTYDQLPSHATCRDAIYNQVLHVPVDDPYLGLATALLPGTPR